MNREKIIDLNEEPAGFNRLVGITKVISDDNNNLRIEFEIKEEHCNIYGIAHGGMLFTLCDTAVGIYAYQKGLRPVTVESHINFHRAVKKDESIIARVIPRKIGKKFSTYLCEVTNVEGKLVVDMMATMFHTKE